MIIDTFLFGWELDMLECRLYEMNSFVDVFIIVEAKATFQGEEKPLTFAENRTRFAEYKDKIIYVVPELPNTDNPWVREYVSRESIKEHLLSFGDDSIIIHGDVDEIVSKVIGHNLEELIDYSGTFVADQKFYSMAVDWQYPISWQGTVFARNNVVRDMTMVDLRNSRITSPRIAGGWHFTWLGGSEMIKRKASSFSHTEDHIQSYIRDMGEKLYTDGYHVLGEKLLPVEIDDTYPNYIKERKCPSEWFKPRNIHQNQ